MPTGGWCWAAPLGLPVFPPYAQEPVEGCPGLCSVATPPDVTASLVALEDVKTSPLPIARSRVAFWPEMLPCCNWRVLLGGWLERFAGLPGPCSLNSRLTEATGQARHSSWCARPRRSHEVDSPPNSGLDVIGLDAGRVVNTLHCGELN